MTRSSLLLSPVILFWAALAALAGVLMLEWAPSPAVAPVKVPPAPVASQGGDEATGRDTEAWSQTVLNRPLFSVNRRAPHTAGGVTHMTTNGMPRLAGVIIGTNSKRAIFMPEGGKAFTLTEGGALDDRTVSLIRPGAVVLSKQGAEDITLRIGFDKARGAFNAFTPTTPGFPNAPVFPNNGFNPGLGAPGLPFPNPVQLQTPPPQGAPQAAPPQGDDGADAPDAGQPAPQIQRPIPPRDRE